VKLDKGSAMLLRVDGSGHQAARCCCEWMAADTRQRRVSHILRKKQGNKEFAGCDAVSFPISSATARDSFLKPVEP
jgi:hypothetical protein